MKNFLKKIKWKHYINYIAISIVLIVYTILSLSGGVKRTTLINLEKVSIAIILAVSLSLVVGFFGELSLGHAGFMCIGAYLGGKVAVILTSYNLDNLLVLFLSLIAGGFAAFVAGVIVGLPALRLRGDYLAIVTLAFGEIVKTIFMNSSSDTFGGAIGFRAIRYDRNTLFIYCYLIVLLMLFVIQNLIRSKHGRAITAIRDSEVASLATGINVTKYKLIVFSISALFAGIAGVLYSFSNSSINSKNLDYNYSIEILVMVVIGGMGNINGTIIAAVLITLLQNELPILLGSEYAIYQKIIYSILLILIIVYNNTPKLKGFRDKYNFKNLFNKIFKKNNDDPSIQRDDEAKWDRVPTKIEMNEILSVDLDNQTSTMNPDSKDKGAFK